MAEMSKWERVEAALAGEAVDRPPVSLWQHFPEQDQTAEALATSTLAWQERYDNDFIKFMPPGDYATIDWGADERIQGSTGGTRETTHLPDHDRRGLAAHHADPGRSRDAPRGDRGGTADE